MLAMVVNDDEGTLTPSGALRLIASMLAPTNFDHQAQSSAGKPQALGTNAFSVRRMPSACTYFSSAIAASGIAIAVIPAALAAVTPNGESSNTRQSRGSTPRRRAAVRKISGAGLAAPTSGSSAVTMKSNKANQSRCKVVFCPKDWLEELVPTAMGMLCAFK